MKPAPNNRIHAPKRLRILAPNNRILAPNNRIHAPNRSIDMHPKGIDFAPKSNCIHAPKIEFGSSCTCVAVCSSEWQQFDF